MQASLRYYLGDNFEFDFIDGAYLWPASPGIEEVFGTQQACYSYYDGTPSSALAAVNDLAAYIAENGPFDIVLGFSLGAALAATLLLQPHDDDNHDEVPSHAVARRLVSSAVFVCGILPVDRADLRHGEMVWLDASQALQRWGPIMIPTVHSWSKQDIEYPGQSQQLMGMCLEADRIELLHTAGHGFPSKTDEVAALATEIQKMLQGLRTKSYM